MTNTQGMLKEGAQESRREWCWVLALGILFVIMGSVGLGMSVGLTLVSMFFFGGLLLLGGVLHLMDAFRSRKLQGAFWHVLIALLYVIGGGLVINQPFFAASMMTIMIASILMIIGVARIVWGVMLRDIRGWGWIIFSGLVTVVLGLMIMLEWPMSGFWFLGLMIAIEVIMTGWTYVFMALAMRQSCVAK